MCGSGRRSGSGLEGPADCPEVGSCVRRRRMTAGWHLGSNWSIVSIENAERRGYVVAIGVEHFG